MGLAAYITSVVTPASSYNLVALDDFKLALGITETQDDAYIDALIASASAGAAQYCNRVFPAETVLDQFWAQRDAYPAVIRGGFNPVQLSRWPLISIDAVTEEGTALVENADFIADYKTGQLVRLNLNGNPRQWANQAITAQYEGGFATIPADLADAVLRLMRARWFARTRDPMLRSENIENAYEAAYWFANGPGSEGFPPDIAAILDNYRVPTVSA